SARSPSGRQCRWTSSKKCWSSLRSRPPAQNQPPGPTPPRPHSAPRTTSHSMAAVSETIVREYFELHGFFVRQQRKYVAPSRREDEEIDFFVLNPRHVAAGQPLPFVLTSEDLHGSKPYGPPGDPR